MKKLNSLTPDVLHILKDKGTEAPFSGKYTDEIKNGSYLCRGCGAVLFRSNSQFHSGCGWPSFDNEIKDAIQRKMDRDGRRTEIVCAHCLGHLGHVFVGEMMTASNQRHCVNSQALEFVPDTAVTKTNEAIVAAGCFWGVQYLLDQLPGVLLTEVGYTGGITDTPTYENVCSHNTHHVEAVRVVFDAEKLSYETILKYFFEIHDPTQVDGQGPDIGSQYRSCIFYFDDHQKTCAVNVIQQLKELNCAIATTLKSVSIFWKAEEDHQHYYEKNKKVPYCHRYTKRF